MYTFRRADYVCIHSSQPAVPARYEGKKYSPSPTNSKIGAAPSPTNLGSGTGSFSFSHSKIAQTSGTKRVAPSGANQTTEEGAKFILNTDLGTTLTPTSRQSTVNTCTPKTSLSSRGGLVEIEYRKNGWRNCDCDCGYDCGCTDRLQELEQARDEPLHYLF